MLDRLIPLPEEFVYLEKEFGLNQEFYEKLNKLSLEQIYKLLSHNRDIAFHKDIGIVTGRFYFTFLDQKVLQIYLETIK